MILSWLRDTAVMAATHTTHCLTRLPDHVDFRKIEKFWITYITSVAMIFNFGNSFEGKVAMRLYLSKDKKTRSSK